MLGRRLLRQQDLAEKTAKERERLIIENAEYMVGIYEKLEYSIIPIHYLDMDEILETERQIRKLCKDKFMLATHGDGTFALPDGNKMYDFAYSIADDSEGMEIEAEKMALKAIEKNKVCADAGIDCFILCTDYCFNSSPFLSLHMFREYIQP